jgi:hypothetical protein
MFLVKAVGEARIGGHKAGFWFIEADALQSIRPRKIFHVVIVVWSWTSLRCCIRSSSARRFVAPMLAPTETRGCRRANSSAFERSIDQDPSSAYPPKSARWS